MTDLSSNGANIPDWKFCEEHVTHKTACALEQFVYWYDNGTDLWRERLRSVLLEARAYWESEPCQCAKCTQVETTDTHEKRWDFIRGWLDRWEKEMPAVATQVLRGALPSVEPPAQPDFRALLEEMWKFWGRPREEEFIDAGVSVAKGMDLYARVSAALGDPLCAKCERRFSQHKTVISHDFTHRSAEETTSAKPGAPANVAGAHPKASPEPVTGKLPEKASEPHVHEWTQLPRGVRFCIPCGETEYE
jgi:hypothetical protein